jgi:hypothetical protein
MAATGSVRIVKEFTYRGATRHFSNRYHIGTAVPADTSHWNTLFDAITAAEKLIYKSEATGGAKIVEAIGYAPGSEVPVATKAYSLDGTATPSGYLPVPGDVAALIRYSTPDRSTKNHPVYCFNYYHTIGADGTLPGGDVVNAAQKVLLQTYAAAWISGFSDGTTTFHRSRPTGDLVTGSTVQNYLTHRDLPH